MCSYWEANITLNKRWILWTSKQLSIVREVLLKNPQPRLKKEVTSSRHMPYGITADYVKLC